MPYKIATKPLTVFDIRFFRFLLVGGIFFLLSTALLFIFVRVMHLHYLLGQGIVFFIINFFSYLLNKYYTFRGQLMVKRAELSRYYLVMLFSLVINLVLMYVLVDICGIHYLIATAGVAGLLTLLNYVAHLKVSFGSRSF